MRARLKRFSSRELLQLFILTSLIVHLIAIVNLLNDLPAWLLYMSLGELLGTVSYTFTFILFETTFIFLLALAVGAVWPTKWTKRDHIFISVTFLFELILGSISINLVGIFRQPYNLIFATLLIAVMILIYLALRSDKAGVLILSFADRASLLTFLYIGLDVLGLAIVIARNL